MISALNPEILIKADIARKSKEPEQYRNSCLGAQDLMKAIIATVLFVSNNINFPKSAQTRTGHPKHDRITFSTSSLVQVAQSIILMDNS